MAALVTIDARDAAVTQLRGWGRYAACLIEALRALNPDGLQLDLLTHAPRGPEVVFEQVLLPLHLRRRRSALVHATNCFLPLARSCPGVVTIHDLAFEAWPEDFRPRTRAKYRALTRLAARSAQRIIVPSDFTAEDLDRRYGVDPGKLRVIPEAPALPLGGLPAPPGPYVLAVGDLRRKKNLDTLVRAFARLHRRQRSGHRLVLAGVDTGQGATLRDLAGDAPLELTGYVSDARLDALIRGAEVVVHPSRYEGFGLVVLEAMARGTPVIAAAGTALAQTAGDAGVLFDAEAPDAQAQLEALLDHVLADDSARAELSRRGLEHARGFSWKRAAMATSETYVELL